MRTTVLLSSAMLFAPALLAQRVPEAAEATNNFPSTPEIVAMGTQIDAQMPALDIDFFQFTTAGGNICLAVNGGDLQMELWDAAATTILAFNDDSRGLAPDLTINLAAGTYLVRLDGFTTTTAYGAYSLEVAERGIMPFSLVEVEPNNSLATAQVVPAGTQQINASLDATVAVPIITGSVDVSVTTTAIYTLAVGTWPKLPQAGQLITVSGFVNPANNGVHLVTAATATTVTVNILAPYAPLVVEVAGPAVSITVGDEDWYQVTLAAPFTGLWMQLTEGENTCISRSRYEIYDALGVLVVAATLGTNSGEAGPYNFRLSQIRNWPAGTYNIVIKKSNSTSTGSPFPTPFGNYRLELHLLPMATGAAVPENVEPNSSAATATPLAPGDTGLGNLSISTGPDASDWWGPFTFSGPSVIQYQTAQGAPTAMLDTTIRVIDATTFAVLITSTTGNINVGAGNLHPRVTLTSSLPISFYLEVLSPLATTSGNYVLQVSPVAPIPYVSALYTIVSSNTLCGNAPRPVLSVQYTTEKPVLGTTFSRSLGVTAPGAPFFLIQGLSNTVANGGATPLPFDMTPFGAPSCFINVDPVAIVLVIANVSGTTILNQNMPNSIVFRGTPIFDQCVVLEPTANALGMQVSNYARQILGERSY